MKVYVCWSEEDYYGPDPLPEPYIFDNVLAAMARIETFDRDALYHSPTRQTPHWEPAGQTMRYFLFYVEQVEVVTNQPEG